MLRKVQWYCGERRWVIGTNSAMNFWSLLLCGLSSCVLCTTRFSGMLFTRNRCLFLLIASELLDDSLLHTECVGAGPEASECGSTSVKVLIVS